MLTVPTRLSSNLHYEQFLFIFVILFTPKENLVAVTRNQSNKQNPIFPGYK